MFQDAAGEWWNEQDGGYVRQSDGAFVNSVDEIPSGSGSENESTPEELFVDPPAPPPPASNRMTPNIADPRHKFVGTDSRGDVYQLIDEGGNVIEWAVASGAPSGEVIPGTVVNKGQPSSMTTATGPAYVAPAGTAPAGDKIPDDPAHKFAGTVGDFDLYELTDAGGNRIRWKVRINDDSRNAVAGSVENLGRVATPAGTQTPLPVTGNQTPPPPSGSGSGSGVPGAVAINPPPPPYAQALQSNPRHKYVGRTQTADVWQIFDGTNVIEWSVPIGSSSGVGAYGHRNLGPPSTMTIAQDDGFRTVVGPGSGTGSDAGATTAAPAEKSTVLVVLGIAASVAGFFK